MGIGMAMVTAPYYTPAILKTLSRAGETARVVGKVVKGPQEVRILPKE
jgi:phosphoribosylaminoimidazole (AIR) synthetase